MADTVSVTTILDDQRQTVVYLQSSSDGTGEAAVSKVAVASVAKANNDSGTNPGGAAPVALDIERVEYSITGFPIVTLLWKATSNQTALILGATGWGALDFTGLQVPRLLRRTIRTAGLRANAAASGFVGDVLLTSPAAHSGATYAITLYLLKRTSDTNAG